MGSPPSIKISLFGAFKYWTFLLRQLFQGSPYQSEFFLKDNNIDTSFFTPKIIPCLFMFMFQHCYKVEFNTATNSKLLGAGLGGEGGCQPPGTISP